MTQSLTESPENLSAEELEQHLLVAISTGDKQVIHMLAEERLSRDEFISGVSRRSSMLRQARDLDIIGTHETWRLGDFPTFYAYLTERRIHYEQQGYDSEGDILVVKGYSTVLAWINILNHFHRRHNITLELLAYVPKGKLETASGVCNRWDFDHADEMDEDLRQLLFDTSVSADDILERYAALKQEHGDQMPIDDTGAKIDPPEPPPSDGADGVEPLDVGDDEDDDDRLDVTMDTETGTLSAWIRRGNGRMPLEIGRFYLVKESQRDLILTLCKNWGIRLT